MRMVNGYMKIDRNPQPHKEITTRMMDQRFELERPPASENPRNQNLEIYEVAEALKAKGLETTILNKGTHLRIHSPLFKVYNYYISGTVHLDGQPRYKGRGRQFLFDLLKRDGAIK